MSGRSDPLQSSGGPSTQLVSKHVLDEERLLIRRQYEMMQHIDDRALRITRTSAVLLGIFVTGLSLLLQPSPTASGLVAPDISASSLLAGLGGTVSLVFSLHLGIVTTQYSQPVYGINERVRDGIHSRSDESKALSDLSNSYAEQISTMETQLERNRNLLWMVQMSFVLGMLLLFSAGASVAYSTTVVGVH